MKINFKTVLQDIRDGKDLTIAQPVEGKYIKNPDGSFFRNQMGQKVQECDETPMTLQWVVGESLARVSQEDTRETAENRVKREKLLEKVFLTPECDLVAEEIVIIKDRIRQNFGPLVSLVTSKILDG